MRCTANGLKFTASTGPHGGAGAPGAGSEDGAMQTHRYTQFCPVALAAEILCSRWTLLVVRELIAGRSHFNEIRRGLPGMSPTLLAKRLRQLQSAGIVEHGRADCDAAQEYHLTPSGRDLRPIIEDFGAWGDRWLRDSTPLRMAGPAPLIDDMRRALLAEPLGCRHCVLQFVYPDQAPSQRNWWILQDAPSVDACAIDPGVAPQVYVVATLRSLAAVWMGVASLADEERAGRVSLTGETAVGRQVRAWLADSPGPPPPL